MRYGKPIPGTTTINGGTELVYSGSAYGTVAGIAGAIAAGASIGLFLGLFLIRVGVRGSFSSTRSGRQLSFFVQKTTF
jgi:hypothetical protein